MYIIFALKWFIAGFLFTSLNFLFLAAKFTCDISESSSEECKKWVCSHDDEQFWREHLSSIPKSLSYEFGYYICTKEWIVSMTQSLLYWGSFVGYVTLPYFADNFGRKRCDFISWLIGITGIIILSISFSIEQAGVGLFLCGMGINVSINLSYTFIK
jgi:MFS family permease